MYPNFALLLFQNSNDEILLARRINTPFGNNCYALPGGQIDLGEPATKAAIRQAHTIFGVSLAAESLECVHVMHRKCNEPEFFAAIFKPPMWDGAIENLEPNKHDDLRWFSQTALPDNIIPAHRHAIEQVRHQRRYSEHEWS